MKARKVKGLDSEASLFQNARRLVRVRLVELYSFKRAVRDPGAVGELHDMRIAAKRLRYVLEITEPAFGAPARRGAKQARALQEVLGLIHDCDEMLPRVESHLARMRAADERAVAAAAPAGAEDLPPGAARAAPNLARYRGLEALTAHLRARRALLYTRFVELWSELDRKDFRRTLERDLSRPARPTVSSPAGPVHHLPQPGSSESGAGKPARDDRALR